MHLRQTIGGALTTALIALPLVAHANSLDDIQGQIAALLAQLTDLKAQILNLQSQVPGATSTSSTSPSATSGVGAISTSSSVHNPGVSPSPTGLAKVCPTLARTLGVGARGADVTSLQQFLASLGLLDADSVSGYFGPLTQAAVQKWQSQNGIVSSGMPESTGWGLIGARTRAAMMTGCGGGVVPQNDTLSIGAAGLTVQAGVNVNTKGSCGALAYTLDWGDGSSSESFSIPAGNCLPLQKSFTHTYSAAGSYTAVLSTSAYRISAPITLSAATRCAAPSFATDSIPGGVVGQYYSLPLFASLDSGDISVSASGEPDGLQVTKSIAVSAGNTSYLWYLSGTPKTEGTYSVAFSAKNACGNSSRTISLPIVRSTSLCASVVTPTCTGGTLKSLGNDSNGCSLGYLCVPKTVTLMCPQVSLPQCIDGQLVSYGTDSNGCHLGYKCVSLDTTTRISVSIKALSFPIGQTVPINWTSANAPANSEVWLSLLNSAGNEVSNGIANKLSTSGTYPWTVPSFVISTDMGLPLMPGAYRVRAQLVPNDTCIYMHPGGGCKPGTTPRSPYASATSDAFTITSGDSTSASFSASPTSGSAPLTVTFSNHATGGPQPASMYPKIDFGDGSPLVDAGRCGEVALNASLPADGCGSAGINTHTYTKAGTYTARLLQPVPGSNCDLSVAGGGVACQSISSSRIIGTVSVTVTTGPIACPAVIFPDPVCPAGQHVERRTNNGCPAPSVCVPDSSGFSASPTSGSAPLYVTFSTNINTGFTADKYKIDFGDGTSAEPASCYAPTDACASPGKTPHTYTSTGTYTASLKKYVGSHCGWNAQPGDVVCQSVDTVTTLGTVTISTQSSACDADIAASLAANYSGQICGQGGPVLQCPYDIWYRKPILNTCQSSFLEARGWVPSSIIISSTNGSAAGASTNLASALVALQAALERFLGR